MIASVVGSQPMRSTDVCVGRIVECADRNGAIAVKTQRGILGGADIAQARREFYDGANQTAAHTGELEWGHGLGPQ
jgi:hypothetical protein